jgi:hypothetical protein
MFRHLVTTKKLLTFVTDCTHIHFVCSLIHPKIRPEPETIIQDFLSHKLPTFVHHICTYAHPIKSEFAENLYYMRKASEGVFQQVQVPTLGMWMALYETRPSMSITGIVFVVACVSSGVFKAKFPHDWNSCQKAQKYAYQLIIPKHARARIRFPEPIRFQQGDKTFRQPILWPIPDHYHEVFSRQFQWAMNQTAF